MTGAVRTYTFVLLALLVLTASTVAVTFLELGRLTVVVGLIIAFTKASLVVMVFMHVRESSALTKFICAGGLLWLAILIGLTFSDYISRGWLPPASPW